MAKEVHLPYGISGKTVYVLIRNSIGQIWNGTAFVSFNGVNWTTYAVLLTEDSTSGTYIGDFPSGISSAGIYSIEARNIINDRNLQGGSPSMSDPVIGANTFRWTGTSLEYQSGDSYSLVSSGGVVLTSTERGNIADKILNRNLDGGSDGGRTVKDALRPNRNKVAFDIPSFGKFTVYKEDDITIAWIGDYIRGPNNLGPLVTTDPS